MSVRRTAAFTLIEMLAVVAILAIAFSMIALLPKRETKDAAVQAAAEELAATMRLARALAISKRSCIGLTFNIQNAAGTSGQLINNWSGGHWYRLIGSAYNSNQFNIGSENQPSFNFSCFPMPNMNSWGDPKYTLKAFLDQVNAGWIDDRHVLKARAVRFLAITDQDNGDNPNFGTWTTFKSTYPRPWCGYYDAGSKRLYPWGGYDHALNSKSAFGLEGSDGALVGCVNPSDRFATDNGTNLKVFSQGAERPIINGEWMDYFLKFNPDGTVEEGIPGSSGPYNQVGNFFITRKCATYSALANIGDMSIGPPLPMTSFEPITGNWSISLAPDIERDCGSDWPLPTYPSAHDAILAISPIYRVQISPLGRVQVVKVRPAPPSGTAVTMDTTTWQASPGTYYQNALPSNSNGSLRLTAHPVDTFLLPGLPQQHWMTSP